MFGIGSTELLVILVVALIALGPKSLAGLSRSMGRAIGEFRRVSAEFQRALNAEVARDEARRERVAGGTSRDMDSQGAPRPGGSDGSGRA